MVISADTPVEGLMKEHPECISFFIQNRLSPFSCAGAYPSALGEMLRAQNVEDVDGFVAGLNEFFQQSRGETASRRTEAL